MPETRALNLFPVAVLIIVFTLLTLVNSGSKCWKWKVIPEQGLYTNVSYPEVKLTQLIPLVTARNLLSAERPSNWTIVNGKINIPSTVELIHLECSGKYRVQWGFESYPWITWNTWTGVERPTNENETATFTATVEFYKVQETSLQTRTPICYSTQDPCIQTAVVPKSGLFNSVELAIDPGSRFEIRSVSEKEQFGTNANCTLKFGYDPESQKFYCQETAPGKSKTAGKIFLRPCSDPITCDSLVADSACNAQPDFPIAECTSEHHCRNETSFAGKFPGIAVCHSGNAPEHSAAIPYFFALAHYNSSTNRTKRYLNWDDANPDDMLELQKFPDVIYTRQQLSLRCNASYFYLGCGMYFDLTREDTPADSDGDVDEIRDNDYDDGLGYEKEELKSAKESVQHEDANIGGIGSKLPSVRTLEKRNFIFDGPGRYELSCFAPVWNGTEWAKASTIITVKESILPQFDGGNQTSIQYYTPSKRLECIAFGMPKPEVFWSRDGGTIPSEISLTTGEQNQTLVWAFLTFPQLKYGIHGNFTCTATNVAGTVRKSIIIIPSDKNSSTAMWFLIGLAIVITLLIPLILFLSWKVRRQRRYIDGLTQEEVDEFINGRPDYIPFQCDMSTYAYYLPYNTEYEIPRESLEIDFNRILGKGEYGLVVYGLYKNANPSNNGPPFVKSVAVKTTKPLTSGKEYFKALLSELKIMTYIGRHTNIVNLIGACTQNIKKKEVYIATEFCENKSLLEYLRMNRYSYENPCYYAELAHSRLSSLSAETSFMTPTEQTMVMGDVQYVKMEDLGNIVLGQQYENIRNIKLQDLLKWSYEIACGMEFLTSKKVIHGDLAARNVLLTRDFTAKIGDFGLSRQLYHYSYYTKTAVTPLPLKWLAIECLQNFQFSTASDIWAYGITLFEVFSIGEIPYSSVQMNGEEFLRALKQGMRLSKPVYAPIDVFGLMMKCWKNDKKQRPTFKDIAKFFHSRISWDKQDINRPPSYSEMSNQRGDEGERIEASNRNNKTGTASNDVVTESEF